MRKNYIFILSIFLLIISCKKEKERKVLYKMDTKDVIPFNKNGIKNKKAQILFTKGLMNVSNEKYDLAKSNFIEANKLENENPKILNAIALSELTLKGGNEKSVKILQNALSIDSTYTQTYANLGQSFMKLKNYENAKSVLLKGMKFVKEGDLDTKSIFLINLAIANNNLGYYETGLKYANEAKKISQNKNFTKYASKIISISKRNLE